MNVLEYFNNREIAVFVWLLIFSLYVIRINKARESFAGLVKTISSANIVIPVLILAVYIGGIAYILSRFGLWNVALLKDTFFWFFSAGMMVFPRKNGHGVKLVLPSSRIQSDFYFLNSNDAVYGYKTFQYNQISSIAHPFL